MATKEKLRIPQHTSFDNFKEEFRVTSIEESRIGRRSPSRLNANGAYSIYARYKKFAITKNPRSKIKLHSLPQKNFDNLPEKQQDAWTRIAIWVNNGLLDRIDIVNYLSIIMCEIDFTFFDVPYKAEEVLSVLERFESKSAFKKSKEFMDNGMLSKEYRNSPEGRKYKKSSLGFIISDETDQSFAMNALEGEFISIAFYRKLAMEHYGKWDISKANPKDKHYHKMLGIMHDQRMPKFLRKS